MTRKKPEGGAFGLRAASSIGFLVGVGRSALPCWCGLEAVLERHFDLSARIRSVQQSKRTDCPRASAQRSRGAHTITGHAGAVLAPPAGWHAEDGGVGEIDELRRKGQ